jgi:hypothetical protein
MSGLREKNQKHGFFEESQISKNFIKEIMHPLVEISVFFVEHVRFFAFSTVFFHTVFIVHFGVKSCSPRRILGIYLSAISFHEPPVRFTTKMP